MNKKTWILEPRDSVIVRDGRPFSAVPGARAATLPFPFPSTIAGAVRTRASRDANGIFDESKIPELMRPSESVSGPLLVQLDKDGGIAGWFAPAPADALLLKIKNDNHNANIKQLKPIKINMGLSNTPYHGVLVGMGDTSQPGKPHDKAPGFWHWNQFKEWLISPKDQNVVLRELGLSGLTQEMRTHVKIDPNSQTAVDSALFQTRGLEFAHLEKKQQLDEIRLDEARRLALALSTTNDVRDGLDFLGGERRLGIWRKATFASGGGDILSGNCPDEVLGTIQGDEWYCRLVLLTPALFNEGSKPTWFTESSGDVAVKIIAAAMKHYQVVSGWDFANGKPKPTRRLTPAGSVFFLKVSGDKENIIKWAKDIWMKCVSDEETDQRDGFGLAVIGNGFNTEELKYAEKTTN